MTLSIKAELDAVMNGSFALHTFPKTHFCQQIDRALLKDPGANGGFDLFPAPAFEHDRIDPFRREEEREH